MKKITILFFFHLEEIGETPDLRGSIPEKVVLNVASSRKVCEQKKCCHEGEVLKSYKNDDDLKISGKPGIFAFIKYYVQHHYKLRFVKAYSFVDWRQIPEEFVFLEEMS